MGDSGRSAAKVVAVVNRKGGIGKTTTALCFAECLAQQGEEVLLVDLDQQHNSTRQYHARIDDAYTVFDMLTDRSTPSDECVQRTEKGDIIAGDDWMNHAEEKMSRLDNREYMLFDGLEPLAPLYDYIVVDCPPNLGIVLKNVLVAADEVIVPMVPDDYSREAFEKLMAQIEAVRSNPRLNPGLKVAGLLLTQYDGRRVLARRDLIELPKVAERFGTKLFDTRIRYCESTKRAQREGVSLYDYDPECTTAQDYRAFTGEYLEGQGGEWPKSR